MLELYVNGKKFEGKLLQPVWEGADAFAARTFTARYPITYAKSIAMGDKLSVKLAGKSIFYGIVLYLEKDAKKREICATAYDYGIYLRRNYTLAAYRGTAREIAKRVAKEIGADAGALPSGGKSLRIVSVGDKTYLDILREACGDKPRIYFDGKAINVRNPQNVATLSGDALCEAKDASSAEKMVNRVIAIRSEVKRGEVQNAADRRKFGTFTAIYRIIRNHPYEPRSKLAGVSRSIKLAGPGDTACVAGELVSVKLGTAGIDGEFRIVSDRHTFLPGADAHYMELALTPE